MTLHLIVFVSRSGGGEGAALAGLLGWQCDRDHGGVWTRLRATQVSSFYIPQSTIKQIDEWDCLTFWNRFSDDLICFRFDRRKMEELLHKNQLSEERKEAEEKEEAIVR